MAARPGPGGRTLRRILWSFAGESWPRTTLLVRRIVWPQGIFVRLAFCAALGLGTTGYLLRNQLLALPFIAQRSAQLKGWLEDAFASGLPKADGRRFTILLAELEGDSKTVVSTSMEMGVLRDLKGLTVSSARRKLRMDRDLDSERAMTAALAQARDWLNRTGADMIVWGFVLPDEARSVRLMAAMPQPEVHYQLLLPAANTEDISEGLMAVVEQVLRRNTENISNPDTEGASSTALLQKHGEFLDRLAEVWRAWPKEEDRVKMLQRLTQGSYDLAVIQLDAVSFDRTLKLYQATMTEATAEQEKSINSDLAAKLTVLADLAAAEDFLNKNGRENGYRLAARLYQKAAEALQGGEPADDDGPPQAPMMRLKAAGALLNVSEITQKRSDLLAARRAYSRALLAFSDGENNATWRAYCKFRIAFVEVGIATRFGDPFPSSIERNLESILPIYEKDPQLTGQLWAVRSMLADVLAEHGWFNRNATKLERAIALTQSLLTDADTMEPWQATRFRASLGWCQVALGEVRRSRETIEAGEKLLEGVIATDKERDDQQALAEHRLLLARAWVIRGRLTRDEPLLNRALVELKSLRPIFASEELQQMRLDLETSVAAIQADIGQQRRDLTMLKSAVTDLKALLPAPSPIEIPSGFAEDWEHPRPVYHDTQVEFITALLHLHRARPSPDLLDLAMQYGFSMSSERLSEVMSAVFQERARIALSPQASPENEAPSK
jgi:hypothetical protein